MLLLHASVPHLPRKRSTIGDEETIAEVARKHPGTIAITVTILVLIMTIILSVSSMGSWLPTFGYYVPHWAYDGCVCMLQYYAS